MTITVSARSATLFVLLYSVAIVYISVFIARNLVFNPAKAYKVATESEHLSRASTFRANSDLSASSPTTLPKSAPFVVKEKETRGWLSPLAASTLSAIKLLTPRGTTARVPTATSGRGRYIPFPARPLIYAPSMYGSNTPKQAEPLDSVPQIYVEQINRAASVGLIQLDSENVKQFVVVTGASQNHFNESFDAVASVQKYLPDKKILYWDFGLAEHQVDFIRRLCKVDYHKFDFSKYPAHIRTLHHKGYKVLAQLESLANYSGIFWMDASIRFLTNNMTLMQSALLKTRGFFSLSMSGHSVYSANSPDLYRYLPSDSAKLKTCRSLNSGNIFMFKTREWFDAFYKWYFLCALKEQCLTPPGHSLRCSWPKGDIQRNEYANCHRYDQSLLNVLVYNHWNFTLLQQTLPKIIAVQRYVTNSFALSTCS